VCGGCTIILIFSIKEPYTSEQLSKPNVIYKNEEEHKISLLSNQT